jgi:hypothetical protein
MLSVLQDLEGSHRLPDAALAFLAADDQNGAQRCYEAAGDWEMAFALLLRREPPPGGEEVRRAARGMIETLVATGREAEAGRVAAEYLQDAEEALRHYTAGGVWRAALAVVGQSGRPALLRKLVAPAAAAAAEAALTELREDTARVNKYWERLQVVRTKRAELAAAVGESPLRLPLPLHMPVRL